MKTVFRIFLMLSLCCSASVAAAQQTVQINFQKYTPGDMDLLMKDILEYNGYKVTVNYSDSFSYDDADYILEYTTSMFNGDDKFNQYSFSLYKERFHPETAERQGADGLRVFEAPVLTRELGRLFRKKFKFPEEEKRLYGTYYPFNVLKVDEHRYIVTTYGTRKKPEMADELFSAIAGKYLKGYDCYKENAEYKYNITYRGDFSVSILSGMLAGFIGGSAGIRAFYIRMAEYYEPSMPFRGTFVRGMIVRNGTDGDVVEISERPAELDDPNLPVPKNWYKPRKSAEE